MNETASHNLNSPFADQRQRGFVRLLFSGFVEEEFRQYYAQSSLFRARVFAVFAIGCTLISVGTMLANSQWRIRRIRAHETGCFVRSTA